jgi:hypothetical protein
MTMNFPEILTSGISNERNIDFRNALLGLDKKVIHANNVDYLTTIYHSTKKLDFRYQILKLLYDFDCEKLKDFFTDAYKKERYLDMKICALRGLSNFINENEVTNLLLKFNEILAKRPENTPYNYQEYELLRGKNALPFLVEKYGYRCFVETLELVNKQYNEMPSAFKGHFTIDENGETVFLRTPEESKALLDKFWEEHNKKFL